MNCLLNKHLIFQFIRRCSVFGIVHGISVCSVRKFAIAIEVRESSGATLNLFLLDGILCRANNVAKGRIGIARYRVKKKEK